MFEGFNESTIGYYQAINRNNCKNTHQENQVLYLEGVKYPLEELYYELYSYFSKIDSDLLSNKRRSLSSAYNDARFCSDTPMKEYFYTVIIFGMSKYKDASLGVCVILAIQFIAFGLIMISIGKQLSIGETNWYLPAGLFLTCAANFANLYRVKK